MLTQMFNYPSIKDFLVDFLISILAFLISLTFHEYAHAAVANALGDPTAKNLGRMTLDPVKHIDPIGIISLIIFGWGWARPVLIDTRNLKKPRRDDLLIAAAGPFTNLVLSFIFYVADMLLVYKAGLTNLTVQTILISISATNMGQAIFNILPIFPLDGYHVFTSIFPKLSFKISPFMLRYGTYLLMALSFSGALDYVISPVSGFFYDLFSKFVMLFL